MVFVPDECMRLFIVRWIGGWETNAPRWFLTPRAPRHPLVLGFCVSVRILPSFPPASVGAGEGFVCKTARDTSARPSCSASARLSRRLRVRGSRGCASLAEAAVCAAVSAPARLKRAPCRLRRRASQLRRAVSRVHAHATWGRRAPEIILGPPVPRARAASRTKARA